MDAYTVLAKKHLESAMADLGHSALPDAPVRPYAERHRALAGTIAGLRSLRLRRAPGPVRRPAPSPAPRLRSPNPFPGT